MGFKDLYILSYPAPILRQVAEPIEEIIPEIAALAERMIDLMVEAQGIGLAGPQVGVGLRLFVKSPTGQREDARVFINPELSGFEGISEREEGCLSLPGVCVKVTRPARCTMAALDLSGERFVLQVDDLEAAVVQHETDHLDGTMIIDRIGTAAKIGCRQALKQLESDYTAR